MGVMATIQPHPVLLDGYREVKADLIPGESLKAFVSRHVPDLEDYEVAIGGVVVRRDLWAHVRPKDGQLIEVRSATGRSVVALIAMAALFYFTLGAGGIAAGSFFGLTGSAGFAAAAGTYVAGSVLINKFIAPKPPSLSGAGQMDATHSLASQRNTFRPYEPVPLLFGRCKITPDLASDQPYTFYRGNDQYLALTLNCGINVDRVDALYNGDALLSSFEGVEDYYAGFSGIAEDAIPLYSNTDTVAGGSLDDPAGTYIQRTSAAGAIRLEVDLEYNIYDFSSDGDPRWNDEGITAQYRAVGDTTWLSFGSTTISGDRPKVQRRTLTKTVAEGQYEVQVKRNGTDTDGSGAHCEVSWSALRTIQADTTNYKGLSRIGVVCKATGQLNGSLDELKCVAYSKDLEYWNGSAWVTDGTHISNPGAQILRYARGFYDADGYLIAGMGLSDDKIDLDAIKAFILHCASNGYTYDFYLKEKRNHQQVLDAICAAGFGNITWSGGKLSVVWADSAQPLEAVANMATIKKAQFQVDYTLAGMADGIVATYLDASDWTNKEIRIAAPGVTTPLNPASIALEGITDEATAAKMARYHLGQSLYQWKSISFGTYIEHLGYQRMSLLSLSHDLTSWGAGGRVQAAVDNAGVVTLTLDEPVPAPGVGVTPYIGLRIPGEGPFRVFEVQSFAEDTNVITLADAWPVDAAFPGDSADNPATDTIWVYDFSTEPGLRVRVVEVQPESDLKGAQVVVAPESDEFWTYVETGEYTPPAASTLPTVRPVVSNVQVDEQVIPQGGTAYTELHVTFDVTGRMDHAVVLAQYTDLTDPENPKSDGEVRKVAETRTREASFRIPGNGQYDIIVRPYSVDGVVGGSAIVSYVTTDTDAQPPPFDTLDVDEIPGGLRRYSWGYNSSTIPPPDIAGAVIRYAAIDPAADPWSIDWSVMTPLGANDGFHPEFFDSFIPPALAAAWSSGSTYGAGDVRSYGGANYTSLAAGNIGNVPTDPAYWSPAGGLSYVFSAKPRTANGIEPTDAEDPGHAEQRVLVTLSDPSLLETVDTIGDVADDAFQNAQDALAAADAAMVAAQDALADAAAMLGAPVWSGATTYASGAYVSRDGVIYKSKAGSNLNHQPPNATWWTVAGTVLATADAMAGQIADHETRIDSAEGTLSSHSSTLSGVVSQITDIEGDVAANAGAISTLTTTVTQKARIFYQADAPTSGMATGDLWIDSDDGNKQYRYSGAAWVSVADTNKVTVYVQDTAPGGTLRIGDVWIETDNNNEYHTWNGTAWIVDSRIASTASAVTAIQASITDIEGDVAANASALSSLSATVTSQGGTISSHSSAITALESTVNDPETGVSATASAVELLEVSVSTNADGISELNAQWSVTLDVNGYVSGVQSVNNGTTSGFYILADQFRVISPGGLGYLFWETDSAITGGGGVLGMSSSTGRMYIGAGFGAAGDLLQHYGTSGNLNAKTLANAIWAVDNSGRVKAGGLWGNFGSGWSSGGNITSSFDASSPSTVTINVSSGTYKVNGFSISYSASSGTVSQARGTDRTYYLYYSDAGMAGGSKSLQISTNPNVTFENTGYVLLGNITVTVPASGSGSGPSRDPYCVHVDSSVLVLRDGAAQRIRAGDVMVGDVLPGWGDCLHAVSHSQTVLADGVRMTDTDGHVYTCSAEAQWRGLDGARVIAGKSEGRVICTADGPKGITRVEAIGPIPVQHIAAENGWYLAGDSRLAYHHNLKEMPG